MRLCVLVNKIPQWRRWYYTNSRQEKTLPYSIVLSHSYLTGLFARASVYDIKDHVSLNVRVCVGMYRAVKLKIAVITLTGLKSSAIYETRKSREGKLLLLVSLYFYIAAKIRWLHSHTIPFINVVSQCLITPFTNAPACYGCPPSNRLFSTKRHYPDWSKILP